MSSCCGTDSGGCFAKNALFASVILVILALVAYSYFTYSRVEHAPKGELDITMYGENYIEEGLTPEVINDGWTIKYSLFEVPVVQIFATPIPPGEKGADANPSSIEIVPKHTLNLATPTNGEGQLLSKTAIPPGNYQISFVLGPIHLVGTASKDGITKTFDWTIPQQVSYSDCPVTLTTEEGKPAKLELTIHSDHLFFDSISSSHPNVNFGPIANSDTDNNGNITVQELQNNKNISHLDFANLPIHSLWDFIELQGRTVGHLNGEHHCHAMQLLK